MKFFLLAWWGNLCSRHHIKLLTIKEWQLLLKCPGRWLVFSAIWPVKKIIVYMYTDWNISPNAFHHGQHCLRKLKIFQPKPPALISYNRQPISSRQSPRSWGESFLATYGLNNFLLALVAAIPIDPAKLQPFVFHVEQVRLIYMSKTPQFLPVTTSFLFACWPKKLSKGNPLIIWFLLSIFRLFFSRIYLKLLCILRLA